MNNSRLHRPARSGFALVLVLGLLTLLSVLVVGFMMRATTEHALASGYKASASTRLMADLATSLVQGQINLATTQGSNIAWTSQPGLVRTFDSSGNPQRIFKLYSAPDMILGADGGVSASTVKNNLAADLPTSSWTQNKALWTDLNAPVASITGVNSYPIIDTGKGPGATPQITPLGFSYTGAPAPSTNQPLPMPVKWLYVLRDGTLVSPTPGGTSSVNVTGDTPANPITGRIAFWTDDETCKVNLNTAADGTFWDTPHGATITDQNFASYQPAQREYQRYPGHPAMTALSAILTKPSTMSDQQWSEQLYKIVPRVVGGSASSQEGTALATSALTPDVDRLYASLDELIFDPARGNSFKFNKSQIEQAKFFLTTHSRAPEVTLSNLPRIACWPLAKLNGAAYDTARTTAYDRLIGMCSTVNGQPYFFQRDRSGNGTTDISLSRNTQLYSYLQYLTSTAIPGYGGDFKTKYGNDRDQILTEIFDYIRCTNLYDGNLTPGNQFTAGYGTGFPATGHGQVVPTQFAPSGNSTLGFGRFYTISELGIGFICNAVADDPTTPADESSESNDPSTNKVLGGTPLAAGEKYIQAIIVYEFFSPMHGWASIVPDMQVQITGIDPFSVAVTSAGVTTTYPLGFPGTTDVNTADYNSISGLNMNGGRPWGGNPGWSFTLLKKSAPARGNIPADPTNASYPKYPFIGIPIKIKAPALGGTMTFNGGPVTVTIKTGSTSTAPGTTVQTLHITLPSGTFPIPNLVTVGSGTTGGTPRATTKQEWWTFARAEATTKGRLYNVGQVSYNGTVSQIGAGAFFNAAFDVVRTVLPRHGDYRIVAGQADVPSNLFVKHPAYDDLNKQVASNLSNSNNPPAEQGSDVSGKYFSTLSYTGVDIPSNAALVDRPESTGDVDNSLPGCVDGAFVNKPDEGNIFRNTPADIPYFSNTESQTDPGSTFFSPSRMMPSPGMFGSLPTGVKAGKPWQTLLFRPQVTHPGAASPKDYLLLDLFWMPVVEPYAISDRFSTAGKINLNYQIIPFTYITRNSALQALLKSEKVGVVKNSDYATFKWNVKTALPPGTVAESRYPIDNDQTLTQFQTKFTNGEVFKSAAEICDIHIVPKMTPAVTAASMASTFWAGAIATGENLRERIYTTLYPRLTTKSNTYTIHYRTQSLKKVPGSNAGVWTEGKDVITGEYRGSTTIERFIDPNSTAIPDYAASPTSIPSRKTLDQFYKWRVVESRQFAP